MDGHPPLPPPPPGAEPEPEAPAVPEPPQRGSGARVAVAFVGLVAVLSAVVVGGWAWLGRPGPCAASTVESDRFGYCVDAPGWRYTNEEQTSLPYDELVRTADAATVRIVAIQLDPGQGLDEVVDMIRQLEDQQGIAPGEVSERRVAGVRAAEWDISLGEASTVQIREVVFVRRDTAWRIQFAASTEAFDSQLREFEQILRSWTFT
jgi:hypothetical protein